MGPYEFALHCFSTWNNRPSCSSDSQPTTIVGGTRVGSGTAVAGGFRKYPVIVSNEEDVLVTYFLSRGRYDTMVGRAVSAFRDRL